MAAINSMDIYKVIMSPFKDTELRSAVINALERRQMTQVPSMEGKI